mgnify:CR=1 FL=1
MCYIIVVSTKPILQSMKRILLSILISLISHSILAIDFSKINTAYWYDLTADVTINHRTISSEEGKMVVFFELKIRKGAGYDLAFLLQDTYEDVAHIDVSKFELDTILQNRMQQIVKLSFNAKNKKLLVISVKNSNSFFYFPVPLKRGGLNFPSFYPSVDGIPIIRDYVKSDSVRFISTVNDSVFYAYHYLKNFPPADPPMGIVQNINPTLRPDSLIRSGQLFDQMADYSFYFIQTDTNSNTGLTLYHTPGYFPVYRSIEETLPTLTYFSKPSELSRIINSADKKVSFDRFWLDLYPTEASARAAIKGYYLKIFAANMLFTDYKQGWKTDRGILYSIFGQPADVYRSNFEETWIYGGGLEFEFRIISNLFAPNFYILKRDDKYQEEWFKKMKAIRGGN